VLPNVGPYIYNVQISALQAAQHIYDISRLRVKMDLQELGCGGMDWIGVAQDRGRGPVVMTLRVP
jgi:hypothetical protein